MNINKDMTTLEISRHVIEQSESEILSNNWIVDLVQVFAEKVLDTVQPMDDVTKPFVLAALKLVAKSLDAQDEKARMFSDGIAEVMTSSIICVQVPTKKGNQ